MPHAELVSIAESIINSINSGKHNDLQMLYTVFQNTLVPALDLIDRQRVHKWVTSYGRTFYQVHGHDATYTVHCRLLSVFSPSCTCPSFAYAVLLSDSQLMCKHVLAVRLAERLNKCVERIATADDVAVLFGA